MEKEETIDAVKLREGNVSLVLDSYDDIFSDFDPRSYSVKSLSDDFLIECKKAVEDKQDKISLRLLVPRHKRVYSEEIKIKRRLKSHFFKHFKEKEKEIKDMRKLGISWFILGTIVMSLSAFLLNSSGFLFKLLLVIGEPAGWFFFWEGLNEAVIAPRNKMSDYIFYKKMANLEIIFLNY